MFGQGWGVGGGGTKVRHLNFLAFFWPNSSPLGLQNCSNLIKYPPENRSFFHGMTHM